MRWHTANINHLYSFPFAKPTTKDEILPVRVLYRLPFLVIIIVNQMTSRKKMISLCCLIPKISKFNTMK